MRRYLTTILVSLIMIIGLLAITNPDRKNRRMFDYMEGRLEHNYIIFSIYKETGYAPSADGRYKIRRRYLGMALSFFEISPEKDPVENE